jgi:hypothetical protein
MDWKYKHFHQERIFPAPRDVVSTAARMYLAESLGWKVNETSEGLTAEGFSFSHSATAQFHLQSAEGGTKVAIDLLVQRAGPTGFMLFDAGGHYNIQIRKWLDGIQWNTHQNVTSQSESVNPHVPASNKSAAFLFNGCLLFIGVMFALYFVVTFISAIVGLLTGNLLLVGRSGTLTIHGHVARIVSAAILVAGGLVVWRVMKQRHQLPAILRPK